MAMGVVEVIGSISKGVYLKFGHEILRQLLQQPVENEAAFDSSLRVKHENDLGLALII